MSSITPEDRWLARLRWGLVLANTLLAGICIYLVSSLASELKRMFLELGMEDKLPVFTKATLAIPPGAQIAIAIGVLIWTLGKEALIKHPRTSITLNALQLGVMAILLPFYLMALFGPLRMLQVHAGAM